MSKFSVYYLPEDIEAISRRTPYNLKQDLKNIERDELLRITEEIANELHLGVHRPPTSSVMYWGYLRKAAYVKIRVLDVVHDSGKSNGYRAILLVDCIHNAAFLLHLYRHGHGEAENISRKEMNVLRELVDEYIASLEQQLGL